MKVSGEVQAFTGRDYPTFFQRGDNETAADIEIPYGELARVSFRTDVKNNYFTRRNHRGNFNVADGEFTPSFHLFNGRITLTFTSDKRQPEGSTFTTKVVITDNVGSGPFTLTVHARIVAPRIKDENKPKSEKRERSLPKVDAGPSRPNIIEADKAPDDPPLSIEKVPASGLLQLVLNKGSRLLADAKSLRPKEETPAVEFVFKYGLALTAMGLLDAAKKRPEWQTDEAGCRERIQETTAGIARVIVPLCLSLPKKLPKPL